MEEYLWQNHIAFKDYGEHVNSVSGRVKEQFLKPFQERNLPVVFERDPETDKEEMARALAVQHKIESGPVCAISAMNRVPPSNTASRISPVGCGPVLCSTGMRSTGSWGGCIAAFRLGFRSASALG